MPEGSLPAENALFGDLIPRQCARIFIKKSILYLTYPPSKGRLGVFKELAMSKSILSAPHTESALQQFGNSPFDPRGMGRAVLGFSCAEQHELQRNFSDFRSPFWLRFLRAVEATHGGIIAALCGTGSWKLERRWRVL